MNIENIASTRTFSRGQIEIETLCDGTLRAGITSIVFDRDKFTAQLRWRATKQFINHGSTQWKWIRNTSRIRAFIRMLSNFTIYDTLAIDVTRCYRYSYNRAWRIKFITNQNESGELFELNDPWNLTVCGTIITDPQCKYTYTS